MLTLVNFCSLAEAKDVTMNQRKVKFDTKLKLYACYYVANPHSCSFEESNSSKLLQAQLTTTPHCSFLQYKNDSNCRTRYISFILQSK